MSIVINERFLDGFVKEHELAYLEGQAISALQAVKNKNMQGYLICIRMD